MSANAVLKQIIDERELSHEGAARLLDVSTSYITSLLIGRKPVTFGVLGRVYFVMGGEAADRLIDAMQPEERDRA